jgi:signal transduction histidine kinase
MACEAFQEDLSALIDGQLTRAEQVRLAAHLQACGECRVALREITEASLLVHELPTSQAPAHVTDNAMRLVRAHPIRSAEPWMRRSLRLFAPLLAKVRIGVPMRPWGLSGKLLALTILFVMIAEILIYLPLIASYRWNWLNDRAAAAYSAVHVLDALAGGTVAADPGQRLLNSIGAQAVAVKMGDQRRLFAISNVPPPIDHDIDIRSVSWLRGIVDAVGDLLGSSNGVVRVVGPAPLGGQYLEIILDQQSLHKALLQFSTNVLIVSLIICGITLSLLYLALHHLFVQPMHRITVSMDAFRANPEDSSRIITVSGRRDELGDAEHNLALMQRDLSSMLQQKNRLAALGLAVAKINHDMRNLLGAAQLFSDQLSSSPDPRVQRSAPKLMRTIERAVTLCQTTLSFGRAQEPPPDRRPFVFEPLVEEVQAALGLPPEK